MTIEYELDDSENNKKQCPRCFYIGNGVGIEYQCDECGRVIYGEQQDDTKCPNCGSSIYRTDKYSNIHRV